MKIILNGYRASGKSTLGQLVAEMLDWPLLDVDRGIEKTCDTTIADIFATHGEPYYRQIEQQVTEQMCRRDHVVISFGGGTIMTPANEAIARRDSLVVYLKASADELWRRMQNDPDTAVNRPNLSCGGQAEVEQMLNLRDPVYQRAADLTLNATEQPESLARIIVDAAKQRPDF